MNGNSGKPHEFFLTRTEKRFSAAAALFLEASAAIKLALTGGKLA